MEKFKKILEEGLRHPAYLPIRMCDSPLQSQKMTIYPLNTLNQLLTVLNEKRRAPVSGMDEIFAEQDQIASNTIRYVITKDHQILFAQEGKRSMRIPAHTDMASTCLAAGSLILNDANKICGITNGSGHFKPEPSCMLWVIALFKELRDSFNFDTEIKVFDHRDNLLACMSLDALFACLPSELPPCDYQAVNSASEVIELVSSRKRGLFFEAEASPKRPMIIFPPFELFEPRTP